VVTNDFLPLRRQIKRSLLRTKRFTVNRHKACPVKTDGHASENRCDSLQDSTEFTGSRLGGCYPGSRTGRKRILSHRWALQGLFQPHPSQDGIYPIRFDTTLRTQRGPADSSTNSSSVIMTCLGLRETQAYGWRIGALGSLSGSSGRRPTPAFHSLRRK